MSLEIDYKMVTELELKEWGQLNKNIDTQLINMNVPRAQRFLRSKVLGNDFYTDLVTKAEFGTFSVAESYLVDNYLKQAIASRAAVYSLTTTSNQTSTKGVQQRSSEWSQPKQNGNGGDLYQLYTGFANDDQMALYDYLEDNYTSFPLYERKCCDDGLTSLGGGWTII